MLPFQLKSSNYSHLWSRICGIWDYIWEGVSWILHDGCLVDFWYDEWLPGYGRLAPWYILNGLPPHCPVISFVSHHGVWDFNILMQVLLEDIVYLILTIIPYDTPWPGPAWVES
ncbi:hypothetical protein V6N13_028948 [Hibiscus sabdariffa]|uniref:Uncharacterized protein n=1 Tax=Hibiscus sabdariffa TaxID=183260 RepID=A0ABR2AWM3_9ROSI